MSSSLGDSTERTRQPLVPWPTPVALSHHSEYVMCLLEVTSTNITSRADVTWSTFCKGMLANVEYIFSQDLTTATGSDTSVIQRLLATREHLLLTAAEIGLRYNDRQPFSRLPPELMHRIFRYVALGSAPRPYDASLDKPGHLGWISLSHVCQRWRAILLDMPTLWASCACIFPSAMKDLISRAQRHPIKLELDVQRMRPHNAPSVFQMALSYIRSSSFIDITVPTHFQETIVYVLTTYELSCTESMKLTVLQDQAEGALPLSQLDLPGVKAPKLRRCYMKNLLIPLAAPALTHLHLTRDTTKDIGFPSPASFLAFLARSPHLKVLHVERWIPDCTSVLAAAGSQLLSFPDLESLTLASTPSRCEGLWRLLHIPKTAMLAFDIQCVWEDLSDLPAVHSLFHTIASHMQPLSNTNGTTGVDQGLSINEDDDFTFHFRLFSARAGTMPTSDTGVPVLSPFDCRFDERLRVRITHCARFEWAEELPSLLSALGVPATHIGTLAVRMFPPTVAARWQIFLKLFRNVTVLHIRSFSVDDQPQAGLVSALTMDGLAGQSPGEESASWMLPKLQELWMRDVVLEESSGRRSTFQERLLDTLRVRSLSRLHIARMPTDVDAFPDAARTLQEDFLSRARQLVPIIHWDPRLVGLVSMLDYERDWSRPWQAWGNKHGL